MPWLSAADCVVHVVFVLPGPSVVHFCQTIIMKIENSYLGK